MENQTDNHYKIAMILVAIAIACAALKYAFNIFLANHLLSGLFGDFVVSLKSLSLAASVLLLGTGVVTKRQMPIYLGENDAKSAVGYIKWHVKFILKAVSIFTLFVAIAVVTLLTLDHYGMHEYDQYHLTLVMLLITPFATMTLVLSNYMHSNGNFFIFSFLARGARFVFLLGAFYMMTIFVEKVDTHFEIIIMAFCAYLAFLIFEIIIFLAKYPQSIVRLLPSIKTVNDPDASDISNWKNSSYSLMLNQTMYELVMIVDIYLIEIILHQEFLVDIYAAILLTTGLIWQIGLSVYLFITPMVARLLEANDYQTLQHKLNQANFVNWGILFVCSLACVFYGDAILSLFGSHYGTQEAYYALLIMLVATILGCIGRPNAFLLAYSGHEKLMNKVTAIELCIMLVVGYFLVTYFGIIGGAIAASITVAFKVLAFSILCRKHVKGIKAFTFF